MAEKLVIAAVCARPFVQAATAARYQVFALDAFGDADTRAAAHGSFRIAYAHGRFDGEQFLQVLHGLDCRNTAGLVYGSGFEAAPALLETVAQFVPLIGNSPAVLRRLKQPRLFFDLLAELKIPHPAVRFQWPESTAGWLVKHGGGSGGTHVRRLPDTTAVALDTDGYYQREATGEAVSVLFAADGRKARVVGFNRQWTAPTAAMPFRYGGVASCPDLPQNVQKQLVQAAQRITAAVGLRGLNSLDAMLQEDSVQVLEINPRLSSTFELYRDASGILFDLHMRACAGYLTGWPRLPAGAKAQQVVYAPHALEISSSMLWPEWAADIPAAGAVIAAESPLCSVTGSASDTAQAKALAQSRAQSILNLIT